MNLPAARTPSGGELVTRARATEISQSRLMPEHFHDNPANVQYVMEIGRSLGIDPVSALSQVHVFESDGKLKCSLSADLMVALARNAGHLVHVTGNQVKATATLVRHGETKDLARIEASMKQIEYLKSMGIDPKTVNVFTKVWTAERAAEIGLTRKFNWKNYLPEMLEARVKAAVVRSGASEVIIGITKVLQGIGIDLSDEMDDAIAISSARYTADELGSDTDDEGAPIRGQNLDRKPRSASTAQLPPEIVEYVKGTPAEDILAYVDGLVADDEEDVKSRISKINMIGAAIQKTGKGDEMVGVIQPDNDDMVMVSLIQAVGTHKQNLLNS